MKNSLRLRFPIALTIGGILVVFWLTINRSSDTGIIEQGALGKTPNIVLITLDTTRADHLGTYGFIWDTSPNIDAIAEESIVFEQCYAPNPTTLPSHTSILTATAPTEHGVIMNVGFGGERFVPSSKLKTFTQYVKANGYQTAAFISAAPLRRGMGLEVGFDTWTEMKDQHRERKAAVTISDWLDWFNDRGEEPFFSWVHLFDAHNPFKPEAPFDTMFQSDESHTKWAKDRDIPKVSYRWGEGASISSRSADEKYAGEIRYMDSQLQRIFDALKSSGEWENTILIITADHGEGLGQHGAPGHGGLLWKEQLHVPLIIHSPFHPPKRVSDIAWSVNIFPTVLSLIDLPNEESFLSQATRPSEFSPKSTDIVLSEVGEGHRSVTTLNWKYIAWNDNSHSLFSLSTDPYELNDISAENTETAEKMFWKLQARVESFRTRAKQFESGKTEQMSPEQIDLLHALGYVSDDHQVEANSARNTNEEAATANEQKRLRSPKHRGQARRPDARK